MTKLKGFTLVELLVALAIFAILSTITASALYNAFQTRSHLAQFTEQLTELQLALSLMTRDLCQTVAYSLPSKGIPLPPSFSGDALRVEFVHGGVINPLAGDKRATLARTAFICQENQLIVRQWEHLDALHYNDYQDRVLLQKIKYCRFSFLDQRLALFPEWRQSGESTNIVLPKAIQLRLTMAKKGNLSYLFALSQAPYQTGLLPS